MLAINPEIYSIKRELDVARVVLESGKLAKKIGFTESAQHLVATTVSELSKNILQHAGEGSITIGLIMQNDRKGIEILAEDKGPGIQDIEKAITERYSTRNTLGLGLSAAKRIMDELIIETKVGEGTVVIARKWLAYEQI